MGNLVDKLPPAKEALKGEDEVTCRLTNVLLEQVYANQSKSNLWAVVQRVLDDEIDKCISDGIIDGNDLEVE